MMKKVLLIAAFAVSAFTASAQTEKGNILLGGTLDFTSDKSKAEGAEADESFTILPVAGFFVSDNLAIGTGVGFQKMNTFVLGEPVEANAFAVAPFGRYYKGITEQFKFFGQLAVPMYFGTMKADGNKVATSTTIGVSLSPGFAYFPAKKFGIELSFNGISYQDTSVEDNNGNKVDALGSSTFNIGADFFNPQVGIAFYF